MLNVNNTSVKWAYTIQYFSFRFPFARNQPTSSCSVFCIYVQFFSIGWYDELFRFHRRQWSLLLGTFLSNTGLQPWGSWPHFQWLKDLMVRWFSLAVAQWSTKPGGGIEEFGCCSFLQEKEILFQISIESTSFVWPRAKSEGIWSLYMWISTRQKVLNIRCLLS